MSQQQNHQGKQVFLKEYGLCELGEPTPPPTPDPAWLKKHPQLFEPGAPFHPGTKHYPIYLVAGEKRILLRHISIPQTTLDGPAGRRMFRQARRFQRTGLAI